MGLQQLFGHQGHVPLAMAAAPVMVNVISAACRENYGDAVWVGHTASGTFTSLFHRLPSSLMVPLAFREGSIP
jgi:hypothetical protein